MSFAKSICMYAVVHISVVAFACIKEGGGDAIFVCLVGLFYIV